MLNIAIFTSVINNRACLLSHLSLQISVDSLAGWDESTVFVGKSKQYHISSDLMLHLCLFSFSLSQRSLFFHNASLDVLCAVPQFPWHSASLLTVFNGRFPPPSSKTCRLTTNLKQICHFQRVAEPSWMCQEPGFRCCDIYGFIVGIAIWIT